MTGAVPRGSAWIGALPIAGFAPSEGALDSVRTTFGHPAMGLREKYRGQYEEAAKWRV